jgi:hypothetical protein
MATWDMSVPAALAIGKKHGWPHRVQLACQMRKTAVRSVKPSHAMRLHTSNSSQARLGELTQAWWRHDTSVSVATGEAATPKPAVDAFYAEKY